jgi:hypothetical protein
VIAMLALPFIKAGALRTGMRRDPQRVQDQRLIALTDSPCRTQTWRIGFIRRPPDWLALSRRGLRRLHANAGMA